MQRFKNFVLHGTSPFHPAYNPPVGDPIFQLLKDSPVIDGHRQPVLTMGDMVPHGSSLKVSPVIPPNLPRYTPFHVTPDLMQNLMETGHLNHSNATGDGSYLTSFNSAWEQWRHNISKHPVQLLMQILDGLKQAVGYVIWNYIDFAEQFRRWDGTIWGLVHGTQLLWRSLVTVALTLGLLELGPLLEALAQWTRLFVYLVKTAFNLTVEAVEMVWYVMGRIWEDLAEGAYKLTHW